MNNFFEIAEKIYNRCRDNPDATFGEIWQKICSDELQIPELGTHPAPGSEGVSIVDKSTGRCTRMSKEAWKLCELTHPDNPKTAALSSLGEDPTPEGLRGADALDALITIGSYCKTGMALDLTLDENHKQFLAKLKDDLLRGLHDTNKSAPELLSEVLGLGERMNGGGAADQWRSRMRDRHAAYSVTMLLASDPKLVLQDAINTVATQLKLHRDTVSMAIRRVGSTDGWTGGLRKRSRGRPRKPNE